MATSGASAFNQTRDQIIRRAGRQVGAWAAGEVPGAEELEDFGTALNAMCKEWQAEGIHVWTESEASLFLVPGQVRYTLGPDSRDRIARSFAVVAASPLVVTDFGSDFGSDFGGVTAPNTLTLASGVTALNGAPLLTTGAGAILTSEAALGFSIEDGVPFDPTQIQANSYLPNADLTVNLNDILGVWQLDGSVFWTTITGFAPNSQVQVAQAPPVGVAVGAPAILYRAAPPDRPLRILSARRYDVLSQQEVSINMMSRLDYRDMPNKLTAGYPNSVFYDPRLNDGALWVWCAVDRPGTVINYTYMRSIESFLAGKDTPDFPAEWINALTWNLAEEMAPEYGVPAARLQTIAAKAAKSKDVVAGFDREPESIYVGVNFGESSR